MKRTLFVIIVTIIFFNISYSQKLKKQKTVDSNANTFEYYYVLAKNPEIKQGDYLYRYRGNVQVKGQFEDNVATGQWIYTPDDNLKIIGDFVNDKKEGEWKYYKNGKLISILTYENGLLEGEVRGYYVTGESASELNYKKGRIIGEYKSYYKNGQIKELTIYTEGQLNGISKEFDKEGKLLIEIEYKQGTPFNLHIIDGDKLMIGGDLNEGNGQFIQYVSNKEGEKIPKLILNYKDGKLHGQVKGFDHKGELFYRGQYMNGYMLGMWNFYLNDSEKRTDQVYHYADSITTDTTKWFLYKLNRKSEKPDIRAGFTCKDENAFRNHIQNNLLYPIKAQELGIKGSVLTRFKVDKLGLVKDVEIISSTDPIFYSEAIRVIRSSPLWVPGFKDQLPVEVLYTFPIVFQLR